MNSLANMHRIVAVLVLTMAALIPQRVRAAAATAPAEPPPGAPKSVFNSQPNFGKDPFFPSSKRRDRVKVVPRPDMAVPKAGVPDWILLKGFSVLTNRKLAIINNRTVEAGEEFFLKPPGGGQPRKFKCVEIKDNSVLISGDGETKELQLRPGL